MRRPLAFQEANEREVALLGRIRLVSVLLDGWSWKSGSAEVVFGGQPSGEGALGRGLLEAFNTLSSF